MLRISKIKSYQGINHDRLAFYPFDLKIGRKIFDLDQKWYELQFESPKRLLLNDRLSFPRSISNNLFYYLKLQKQFQQRCLHFSKYLINSNVYQSQINNQILNFSPFQIIQFYQIKNHYFMDTNHQQRKQTTPNFVHAGITLGNGLCLSKIGYLGIFVTEIKDIMDFYETDETYIKICSSHYLLETNDQFFQRNILVPNTIDSNEEY
jgi:hypothetical protein